MLYEIESDKFAEKINGQLVPRGRIQLREGLNTVLGDKAAQNSIGIVRRLLIWRHVLQMHLQVKELS